MKVSAIKLRGLMFAAMLFLLAVPLIATAEDIPAGAWAGTWVASTAKSKFPGTAPKLDQVTIQADGTIAVHVESADGKVVDWSYKPQVGKFVPIQGRDNATVKIVTVSDYRLNKGLELEGEDHEEPCDAVKGWQDANLLCRSGQRQRRQAISRSCRLRETVQLIRVNAGLISAEFRSSRRSR
jgi:hypothetical protein